MKKYVLFIAAFTACTIISCNKEVKETPIDNTSEEITTTPSRRTVTISAECEQETKTTYAGGTTFSWTTGDKISVLTYNSSTGDYKYEDFVANSTAASSKFTGSLDSGYELAGYALFPASDDHDYDPSDELFIKFDMPKYKDNTSNNSADFPMVAEKSGDVYAFKHCSGVTKLTVDNIPAKYTAVTITFITNSVSNGVKLSGTLGTRKRSSGFYAWDPAYAANSDERTYSRKVPVTSNTATVYIPYATGGSIYGGNTVEIVGHDGVNNDVLYSNTSVAGIPSFTRATVIPLAPLHINNLKYIDWSSASVSTFGNRGYIDEWKATSDAYYIYFRVKIPANIVTSSRYIYTGFNTNGITGDGIEPEYSPGLDIVDDIEALSLVYPFSSVDATTITFKDGVDASSYIQCPVKTTVGKVTTWGYQEGDLETGYAYVIFAIQRSKIGSPDGTIQVQHSYRTSPSVSGYITLN